ncbi:MAG: hypothetical protein Q7S40_28100 [Opitutaceae bacterium]|nr:hypothetical protein [Opitutaceae bacterium]
MRLFRPSILSLLLVAATVAGAAEVEFKRVWPGWRDAESFERISEYFGRGENPGREIIVRTQPSERAGYYFLVRVKSATAIPDARFEVQVVRPDSPDVKTFKFSATVPPKENVFQLGLTGADWPDGSDANPVAWKLSLHAADGRVLAEHKSFLWEKPTK